MTPAQLLIDAFDRVPEAARTAVEGLDTKQLTRRPDPGANSVGWLVWHLSRVLDAQVADLADREQAWTVDGWQQRFALPFDRDAHGYGQGSHDVAQVRVPGDLLLGYLAQVHEQTTAYLRTLTEYDLDHVIDASWDPPVTVGVRLVSTLDDCAQHAGQAAYLRGLIDRDPGLGQ